MLWRFAAVCSFSRGLRGCKVNRLKEWLRQTEKRTTSSTADCLSVQGVHQVQLHLNEAILLGLVVSVRHCLDKKRCRHLRVGTFMARNQDEAQSHQKSWQFSHDNSDDKTTVLMDQTIQNCFVKRSDSDAFFVGLFDPLFGRKKWMLLKGPTDKPSSHCVEMTLHLGPLWAACANHEVSVRHQNLRILSQDPETRHKKISDCTHWRNVGCDIFLTKSIFNPKSNVGFSLLLPYSSRCFVDLFGFFGHVQKHPTVKKRCRGHMQVSPRTGISTYDRAALSDIWICWCSPVVPHFLFV